MINTEGKVRVTNTGPGMQRCGAVSILPGGTETVGLEFVAEYGHVPELKFDFSALSDNYRSRTDDGKPYFDFWCPLSMVDGYGRHAIAIYEGLQEIASPVLRDVGWVDHLYLDGNLRTLSRMNRSRVPSKVRVIMTLPYDPHLYECEQGQTNICLTQFETDHVPYVHTSNINKCAHLIVTSSYQVEVMKQSGVRIPISVMTPGVDTDFFAHRPRTPDGTFKVLILGALTGRKNPMGAIQIFQEASRGDGTWRLTIKSRRADGIDKVQRVARKDDRISVVVEDTHPDRVRDYYHSHDCLLWPSKGEGCGLPPLEAMSCGLEVVCSYNSGMMDFIDDRWAYPIATAGMESSGPENGGFSEDYIQCFGNTGSWWVPDHGDAVRQLRRAHAAWADGKPKGPIAAEYVRDRHTLRHQAQSILDVVEGHL